MKNREKRREAQVPLFFRALLFAALCLTPPVFEAVPASAAMPDAKFIDLCASGEIGAVRQAIKGGANPNAHNQYGGTALMFAVN
ncbi:MAG: hypothetical protein IKX21_02175, partial [Deltaproteobacteria bacterium]|nr:hypothetical protein [Deltaproteobacteria bacterium]